MKKIRMDIHTMLYLKSIGIMVLWQEYRISEKKILNHMVLLFYLFRYFEIRINYMILIRNRNIKLFNCFVKKVIIK